MARGLPGVCAISLNPSADSEKIGDSIVGFHHTLNFSTEPLPRFQRWNYFLVQCVSYWLLQCLYKLAVNRSFLVNRFPEDR